MKLLNIKDLKNKTVLVNINQVKKISTSKGNTLFYFEEKLIVRTKTPIDEIFKMIEAI
nr:hypothetical protein [Allomuricauda sp.]|tara:strand:+ start:60 stop:233 length:174 start_codon:yes stop_codon:yes gene_type:complete